MLEACFLWDDDAGRLAKRYGRRGRRPVTSDRSGSMVGQVGYITVPIPSQGPGEVMLQVRGGTEAFAAWSDEPIPKHTRVVVIEDRSGRSVTVAPV